MFEFIKKLMKKKDNKGIVETAGPSEMEVEVHPDCPIEVHVDYPEETVLFKDKETEKKMPSTKGLICINNGEKNRYIHPDDPIPEGWVLGGKKKNK